MASYVKHDIFVEDLANKVHDLGADTLTLALVANGDPPVAGDVILANLTGEIAYTNLASSRAVTITSAVETSGVLKLILADVVLTATGAVAEFQWVDLWNDTPAGPVDPLISFWDHGTGVTLANTETFTIDFSASNGVLTIT